MSRNVVLISTYELGRQPFGLASPAAWLSAAGATVSVQDLAICALDPEPIRSADVVAFYVPMHTATRLAIRALQTVKDINPEVATCFYGLYASMNEAHLRSMGVDHIVGGEYEARLTEIALGTSDTSHETVTLDRLHFKQPDRSKLPALDNYARLRISTDRDKITGYTEASRGCRHLCRHCPIVPVYEGSFRIVQPDIVLADIDAQVASGAEHITFGDPDFFNGPVHAARIVEMLHERHPNLTYDVTIKVEHLLQQADLIPKLRNTGCVLVTSAVESFDDTVLAKLDKGHTADEVVRALRLLRSAGLAMNPTFVAFTPWITADAYAHFLATIAVLGLVHSVAPVQYAIRLLIPQGSRLLELPDVSDIVEDYDPDALAYRWRHPDPAMDELQSDLMHLVQSAIGVSRHDTFHRVWDTVNERLDRGARRQAPDVEPAPIVTVPYLTEPWYC